MAIISRGLLGLAVLLCFALLIMPAGWLGLTPGMARAGAVIALAIGLWSTGIVPPFIGSLIFLFSAMVLGVAPAPVVFAGFHAGALWLVFGGLILGLAVKRGGLDLRLVAGLVGRFPKSYVGLLYGIFVLGTALAFVLPSASARVALLVPLILALAARLGFAEQSRGRAGLVLAAAMGTMVPAFAILPANVPNMGLFGAAESIYAIQLTYGDYMALNFPVLGLGAIIFYPALIALLFADQPGVPEAAAAPAGWSGAEKRLTLILGLALALWMSDTIHGISPAWVALGAGLLCVIPGWGLLSPKAIAVDLDYGPVLFLAGIIGLGALATHAGLGGLIAERLLDALQVAPGRDGINFASLAGIGAGVGVLTTLPAQPAIIAPMAQAMAEATGWPVISTLMVPLTGWMFFPFPYQAPPLVIAVALGGLRIAWVIRLLVAYMVLGALVLLPLHYLWGRWLGYFGGVS